MRNFQPASQRRPRYRNSCSWWSSSVQWELCMFRNGNALSARWVTSLAWHKTFFSALSWKAESRWCRGTRWFHSWGRTQVLLDFLALRFQTCSSPSQPTPKYFWGKPLDRTSFPSTCALDFKRKCRLLQSPMLAVVLHIITKLQWHLLGRAWLFNWIMQLC